MSDPIFRVLSQSEEGLSSQEICRKAMRMNTIDPDVASRIVQSLLQNDSRFFLDIDGRWKVVKPRISSQDTMLGQFLHELTYCIIDVETTGMRPPADRVIEVGVAKVYKGKIIDRYASLINPFRPLRPFITGMTGIRPEMLRGAPAAKEVFPELLNILKDTVFVAHHARFDYTFCRSEISRFHQNPFDPPRLCTVKLGRRLVPGLASYNLESLASHFGFRFEERHRALGDAEVTAMIFIRYLRILAEQGVKTLKEAQDLEKKKLSSSRTK